MDGWTDGHTIAKEWSQKYIKRDFYIVFWVMYYKGGTWGCFKVSKICFSEHGHVAYQIEGVSE